MDYSPPGSSVHGSSQARLLVWIAISFPRGFFPTWRSNLSLLLQQVDSSPLRNQGSQDAIQIWRKISAIQIYEPSGCSNQETEQAARQSREYGEVGSTAGVKISLCCHRSRVSPQFSHSCFFPDIEKNTHKQRISTKIALPFGWISIIYSLSLIWFCKKSFLGKKFLMKDITMSFKILLHTVYQLPDLVICNIKIFDDSQLKPPNTEHFKASNETMDANQKKKFFFN